MGKKAIALITDMDQPLGHYAGHSLEVDRSIEVLKGRGPKDLRDLSSNSPPGCFISAAFRQSPSRRKRSPREPIASGEALKKFREMVQLQGGSPSPPIDDPTELRQAKHKMEVA